MSNRSQIVVRGQAIETVDPDRGHAVFEVEFEGPDREDVTRRAHELCEKLDELLADASDGVERSTVSLAVTRTYQFDENHNQTPVGWSASRTTRVSAMDPPELSRLLSDAAELGVQVGGVAWTVDEENEVWGRLRVKAATDARHRAEAYAEGAGVEVDGIVWLAEDGMAELALGTYQARHHGGEEMLHSDAFEPLDASELGYRRRFSLDSMRQRCTLRVQAAFDTD